MSGPVLARRIGTLLIRFFAVVGMLVLLGAVLLWVERQRVAEWCLRQALQSAGATGVSVRVTRIGFHEALVSPLQLDIQGWKLSADALTLRRNSLLGELSVNGRVNLEVGQHRAAVELKFQSTQPRPGQVDTVATAAGEGLAARVEGSYFYRDGRASFKVAEAKIDWGKLQDFAKPWLPRSLSAAEIGGQMSLEGQGTIENGRFAGRLAAHLREGSFTDTSRHIDARKIDIDLVLPSLPGFESPPEQAISVGQATVGGVVLGDAGFRFQILKLSEVRVSRAAVSAFGGKITADPFSFDPAVIAYGTTLRGNDLRIEDILALFPQSQATASGRMDLELPVSYDAGGLHFGRGWLGVSSGQTTTVVFHWPGLLTKAVSKDSPIFESLRMIETGEAPMKVSKFHADVFPAHSPGDRSVAITLAGRPAGAPSVLGDVDLDLNVNGPLESLMNIGLQSNLSTSFGK